MLRTLKEGMKEIDHNQRLFYTHLFLREFFRGLGFLGWVYLYTEGVSLVVLLVGLLGFRVLQSVIFTPVSKIILKRLKTTHALLLSISFHALFVLSFYLAAKNVWCFPLTILLLAFYDTLYYTIRSNLERLLAPPEHIAKTVGNAKSSTILANIAGLIIFAHALQEPSIVVFLVSAFGIIASYLPLHFISQNVVVNREGIWPSSKKSLRVLCKSPLVAGVMFHACMAEIVELFVPLLLAKFEVSIVVIGYLFALMQLLAAVSVIIVGVYEDRKTNFFFYLSGGLTVCLFLVFSGLPVGILEIFVVLFGFVGETWSTIIHAKFQKYSYKHFNNSSDGGLFLQWIDNLGRVGAYPLAFISVFFPSSFHRILFVCSATCVSFSMGFYKKYRNRFANP